MQSHIVIVIVIVNTTSYIAPLVASHFQDASQERSLSALYLILGITDQVQFQLFFESRKGFGFPNSCRKTVPGTWTSDLKGSIMESPCESIHLNLEGAIMSYPNDGKRQDGATLVLCTRGKYIRLGCKLGMRLHVRELLHPATSVEGYRMDVVGCAWERSRTRCRPEIIIINIRLFENKHKLGCHTATHYKTCIKS